MNNSCGECVFEAVLNAQVVDVNGDALADVLVRTCQGERCAVAEADDNCVSTITDSDGRFSFEIPQCRLEPAKCEVRPLLLEAMCCEQTTARVDMSSETDHVRTYECEF